MDLPPHIAIAGKIDQRHRDGFIRQHRNTGIIHHGIVITGGDDEIPVGGRGQADDPLSAPGCLRQTKRGFRRSRSQHQGFGRRIRQHHIKHERRGIKRPEQRLHGFRAKCGAGRNIIVVNRGQFVAVCRAIGEAARRNFDRGDDNMARHRPIAVKPRACGNAFDMRFDHASEAPHRHDAKAFGRREEPPIGHVDAMRRIGHVVGRQRKAFDMEQHLAGAGGKIVCRCVDIAECVAPDVEFGCCDHGASPYRCGRP